MNRICEPTCPKSACVDMQTHINRTRDKRKLTIAFGGVIESCTNKILEEAERQESGDKEEEKETPK